VVAVRYGVYVPNNGSYGSVRDLVELAECTEASGWDGFFTWDTLTAGGTPVADAQITLAAIAASTDVVTFGALVTPLGRRRPWKLAREIAALAELARGRFVMGCSTGSGHDFAPFPGEVQTAAERAARFVDAMEMIRQFLSGSPIEWTQSERSAGVLGEDPTVLSLKPFLPAPVEPVPFWGGASVQRRFEQKLGPFKRAAKMLDGLFPVGDPWDSRQPITLEEFARAVDYTFEGSPPPEGFDLVACGCTLTGQAETSGPGGFANEGATWWLEVFPNDATPAQIRPLIEAGPPRE